MHEGRIFIERNPRVFRMVLKYIRSNGKLNLAPLKQTDDFASFEDEMNFWGIDQSYDPTVNGPVDLTDTIITTSPKPVPQLRSSYAVHQSAAPLTETQLKSSNTLNLDRPTLHLTSSPAIRSSNTYSLSNNL